MESMYKQETIDLALQVLAAEKDNLAREAADDAKEAETYAAKANMSAKLNGTDAAFANARYATSAATTARDAAQNAVRVDKDDIRSAADAVYYAGYHRDKAAEQMRMAKFFYENVENCCSN